jgi:hypothetical protein
MSETNIFIVKSGPAILPYTPIGPLTSNFNGAGQSYSPPYNPTWMLNATLIAAVVVVVFLMGFYLGKNWKYSN